MSEILRSFSETIRDDGGDYFARVVGRPAADGMWEGWLEFLPVNGTPAEVLVSPVESRQPERAHLAYWASGLSPVYAEGSLRRAQRPLTVHTRVEAPVSDGPAARPHPSPAVATRPMAVLDPFAVGSRSLDVLRQELHALGRARLFNIVAAYDMNPNGEDLTAFSDAQLATFIVTAVDSALTPRRG